MDARNYFNKLEFQNEKPNCEANRTNLVQNDNLDTLMEEKWKQIYRITFYSIADNDVIWFQYHILYKILGKKDYLKLNISADTTCSLCNL